MAEGAFGCSTAGWGTQTYFVDMGFHWGEWLEPGTDSMQTTMHNMMHGEPEVATAYLFYGCRLMAEMASALGRWDGIDEEGKAKDSLNHYSPGSVVSWLLDRVCGINFERGKITIQPYPDRRLGFAEARYRFVHGEIWCRWEYGEETLDMRVEIPCGCTATVILPNGRREEVECGRWSYELSLLELK